MIYMFALFFIPSFLQRDSDSAPTSNSKSDPTQPLTQTKLSTQLDSLNSTQSPRAALKYATQRRLATESSCECPRFKSSSLHPPTVFMARTSAGRHQIDPANSAPLMCNFNYPLSPSPTRGQVFITWVHLKVSSNPPSWVRFL
jgi:hypothetical protein